MTWPSCFMALPSVFTCPPVFLLTFYVTCLIASPDIPTFLILSTYPCTLVPPCLSASPDLPTILPPDLPTILPILSYLPACLSHLTYLYLPTLLPILSCLPACLPHLTCLPASPDPPARPASPLPLPGPVFAPAAPCFVQPGEGEGKGERVDSFWV